MPRAGAGIRRVRAPGAGAVRLVLQGQAALEEACGRRYTSVQLAHVGYESRMGAVARRASLTGSSADGAATPVKKWQRDAGSRPLRLSPEQLYVWLLLLHALARGGEEEEGAEEGTRGAYGDGCGSLGARGRRALVRVGRGGPRGFLHDRTDALGEEGGGRGAEDGEAWRGGEGGDEPNTPYNACQREIAPAKLREYEGRRSMQTRSLGIAAAQRDQHNNRPSWSQERRYIRIVPRRGMPEATR
ncbi:hypothetical protein B0H11DRAFT_2210356 [Mycena galericulata]|nr:hypothetical protein B0H11DRAFT_2210356 [Mycena galericulata]